MTLLTQQRPRPTSVGSEESWWEYKTEPTETETETETKAWDTLRAQATAAV